MSSLSGIQNALLARDNYPWSLNEHTHQFLTLHWTSLVTHSTGQNRQRRWLISNHKCIHVNSFEINWQGTPIRPCKKPWEIHPSSSLFANASSLNVMGNLALWSVQPHFRCRGCWSSPIIWETSKAFTKQLILIIKISGKHSSNLLHLHGTSNYSRLHWQRQN